jgi:2-oxoglutarate ferredoxin oxidoreductase subunit beta
VRLKRVGRAYDPTSRRFAFEAFEEAREARHVLTGLLYFNPDRRSFVEQCRLVERPLAELDERALRPPPEALEEVLASLR